MKYSNGMEAHVGDAMVNNDVTHVGAYCGDAIWSVTAVHDDTVELHNHGLRKTVRADEMKLYYSHDLKYHLERESSG